MEKQVKIWNVLTELLETTRGTETGRRGIINRHKPTQSGEREKGEERIWTAKLH